MSSESRRACTRYSSRSLISQRAWSSSSGMDASASSTSSSVSSRLTSTDADIGIVRAVSMMSRSSRRMVSRSYACWSLIVIRSCAARLGRVELRPPLGEAEGDLGRDHARHVAAEARHLAHQAGGEEGVLRAGGDEERVDARELLVHLGHLQLVVEVG